MATPPKLPLGFQTAGAACGIKSDPQKLDLALFAASGPCTAAGVFTTNRVCGAPVHISRERVPRTTARAVIINSGNANACTAERGLDDARWMTATVAESLGCAAEDVLVCSTGVIGHYLPKEKLAEGLPRVSAALGNSPEHLEQAARGMMTTDTVPKLSSRTVSAGGQDLTVTGVAKGAAMIGPNMATMLSVVMTDARLTAAEADAMLRTAVDQSFHCIAVEGHTSTSDSVILLASGQAMSGPLSEDQRSELQQAINEVTAELARKIIEDAEGATHIITIDVTGLPTRGEAHQIARTIAEGALVKTAITGADPNWGRIISAAGYAGVELVEEDLSLKINRTLIYERGRPVEFDETAVSNSIRSQRDVLIELECSRGTEGVRFWTSDLTEEYVRLNSEYTT
ncbi:MAG: bifunctional glutamate N-acetyltransferase/amino-acid acetyltransferase ArgJ [Planctomycetaceae bacterium]|nr:bifunctional glutamate N-acetyltransferase/amino-acid acetyltransferase ArgJ [Planctomycetaceae bacterium]